MKNLVNFTFILFYHKKTTKRNLKRNIKQIFFCKANKTKMIRRTNDECYSFISLSLLFVILLALVSSLPLSSAAKLKKLNINNAKDFEYFCRFVQVF